MCEKSDSKMFNMRKSNLMIFGKFMESTTLVEIY